MMTNATTPTMLRFVPADAVETRVAELERLPIETADRQPLGHLAGVVIDLISRRLRYVVVERSRWAGPVGRLVPFSMATIDRGRRSLRLDIAATIDSCPAFDPEAFQPLTRDELFVAV